MPPRITALLDAFARLATADADAAVRAAAQAVADRGDVLDTVAMRRVNDSLGYRVTHRSRMYQLDL